MTIVTDVTTSYYGRDTQLAKLDAQRKDYQYSYWQRKQADKSLHKILKQLENRPLMRLRERLIKAAQAKDDYEQAKIQQLMRELEGNDRETGLYEQA